MLYLCLINCAALYAKLRSSFGTYLLSRETRISSLSRERNSIRSDKSMVVMTISTSWNPSSRFPSTSNDKLIFAGAFSKTTIYSPTLNEFHYCQNQQHCCTKPVL